MQQGKRIRILLVDDDEVDRMAVLRGLDKAGIEAEIKVAKDGIEALECLRGDKQEPVPRPYMVLLDLNMPRLDGLGFLEEIRSDESLRRTVVFVLTTSENDEDKLAAYNQLVAGYVVKSEAGKNFEGLVSLLLSYWEVVALPRE